MKVVLCGMLYRDAGVVLEMLRSTLPYVDEAVFATAPLPFMPELPEDGTNQIAQEYADSIGKSIRFDIRPGLSHEQQNHCLGYLRGGDYVFWVAADEVATGDVGKALEFVKQEARDVYAVGYRDRDQLKTVGHYLQIAVDALRTRSRLLLKTTIIKYHRGDHFANNHWSYYDADGKMVVEGMYRAVNGRSQTTINPRILTMVDIADRRGPAASARRKERYQILRTHGWDERKI